MLYNSWNVSKEHADMCEREQAWITDSEGRVHPSIMHSPLAEFLEGYPVWKSFSADTDTFQHTITPQLMQYKWRLDHTSFLVFIWNNATYKMRASAVQGIHKTCKLFLNEKEDNRMNQNC